MVRRMLYNYKYVLPAVRNSYIDFSNLSGAIAAEEPVGGDWLLAALIAYFFTMLIFVFVDPAGWQNSWRGLDFLVVPQQRTFYQKNTGAVLLNVSSGPNSISTSVNC